MQTDVDNLAKLCEQLPDYGKLIVDQAGNMRWVRLFKVQAPHHTEHANNRLDPIPRGASRFLFRD